MVWVRVGSRYELVLGTSWLGYELAWYDLARVRVDRHPTSQIEAVQRRFIKRITGMSNLSYYLRLKELHLENLELRRLRTDLLTVYKILFGLLNTSTDMCSLHRGLTRIYVVTHTRSTSSDALTLLDNPFL